jgi:hypothetical protein
MKMWIVPFLLAFIVSFTLGCGALLGDAQLGRYVYTQNRSSAAVAPIRVIPIWIDKGFGAADRIEIDNAIIAWNYAMNGYVVLKAVDWDFDMEVSKIVQSVSQNGWLFMKITEDNPMVPVSDKGYKTIGFTERVGGHHLYLVRDRLQNEDVFGVTLHEIGHLMGSEHVGQRLMYPHFTRARFQCIDYETASAVAEAWDIQVSRLNYCVDKGPGDVTDMTPDKLKQQKIEMDQGPLL